MIPPMSFYGVPRSSSFPDDIPRESWIPAMALFGLRYTMPPCLYHDARTVPYLEFVESLAMPFNFHLYVVDSYPIITFEDWDHIHRALRRLLERYDKAPWLLSLLSVGLWPGADGPVTMADGLADSLPIGVFERQDSSTRIPPLLQKHYLDNFT